MITYDKLPGVNLREPSRTDLATWQPGHVVCVWHYFGDKSGHHWQRAVVEAVDLDSDPPRVRCRMERKLRPSAGGGFVLLPKYSGWYGVGDVMNWPGQNQILACVPGSWGVGDDAVQAVRNLARQGAHTTGRHKNEVAIYRVTECCRIDSHGYFRDVLTPEHLAGPDLYNFATQKQKETQ